MINILNNRCRNILKEILKHNSFIKVADFAVQFRVSERTIRNDLTEINYFLKSNGLPELNRKQQGFSYTKEEAYIKKLKSIINNPDQNNMLLTPDERMLEILYDFMLADGFLTLDQQAVRMGISKSTVMKDIDHLKAALYGKGVSIVSGLNGSRLSGEESAIRRGIVDLFLERMDRQTRVEALEMLINAEGLIANNVYLKIFEDSNSDFIVRCLQIVENSLQEKLTDDNCLVFATSISIQLRRMAGGHVISDSEGEMNTYILSYKIVDEISTECETMLGVVMNEPEKRYLCNVLEDLANETLSLGERINRAEVQMIGCYVAENVSERSGYNFLSDPTLLAGVSNELLTILLRHKTGFGIRNPLLERIRANNGWLFQYVTQSLAPFEKLLGCGTTPDEAGYITIHFLDAWKRIISTDNQAFNVLVVCCEGETLYKMICSRLTSQFDVNIIDSVGYRQARDALDAQKVDFVVSTIDTEYKGIPCMKVSPLLTETDIDNLKRYLPTRVINESLIEKISDVVYKYCVVKEQEKLMSSLYDVLGISNMAGYNSSVMPTLEKALQPDNIVLDYPAENWQDAVHKAGELLYDNGYIQKEGIAAIQKNMYELKENSVVTPGVMMAHSKSYELTYRIGISMVRLRQPVKLLGTGEEIDIVFGLAALNNRTHLVALSQLAHVINSEERLHFLRREEELMSILNIFRNNTKKQQ